MRAVVACLCFLALLAVSFGQVSMADGQILRNQVLTDPSQINYYSLVGPQLRNNITFIAYPCLGSLSIFVATNYLPTTNRSVSGVYYSVNDTVSTFIGAENRYVGQNQTTFAGLKATRNGYNNVPANSNDTIKNSAAVYDILATSAADNVTFATRIPFVQLFVTNYGRDTGAGIGYITFPLSTNPLDSYSYWRYNGTYNFDNTGYISGSACGVRLFMEPAYPVKTTNNNDRTRTVEFSVPFNEPGFQYHSFVVIISRDCSSLGYDCFDGLFQRVDISGSGSMITFSWIAVVFFAAFLMMLF